MAILISANFSNAKLHKGGAGQDLPAGFYSVRTENVTQDPAKPNSVKFSLVFTEPGFEGIKRSLFPGTDLAKQGNQNTWLTIWASHGNDVSELQTGSDVSFDAESLIGRDAFVFVREKAEGQQYADITFVPPEAYLSGKEAAASAEAPSTVAAPAPKPATVKPAVVKPTATTPVSAPVPAAGGANSKIAELLAKRKAAAEAAAN